ncbi:hypothetical protein [Tahibacter soli]|uniref:Uncharacterized protein n=1 Tax=Tahibacter soli TaxID=2983605 RepID=A0A9X3YLD1_9GAMM|nr:hypothetical protein [Tahibacter soli]MDC8013742.1 hypothetical protein [Tahibacter soli]
MKLVDDLKSALRSVDPGKAWSEYALKVLSSEPFNALSSDPGSEGAGSLAATFTIRIKSAREAGLEVSGAHEVVDAMKRLPPDTSINVLVVKSEHYLVQGFRHASSGELLGCLVLKRLRDSKSWHEAAGNRSQG